MVRFYDDFVSPVNRALIHMNRAFPVVQRLLKEYDNLAICGNLASLDDATHHIRLCDANSGLQVLRVRGFTDGTILVDSMGWAGSFIETMISSKRIPYVNRVVSKRVEDRVISIASESDWQLGIMMQQIQYAARTELPEPNQWKPPAAADIVWAMRVACGEITVNDVPLNILSTYSGSLESMRKSDARFKDINEAIEQLASTNKFIVGVGPTGDYWMARFKGEALKRQQPDVLNANAHIITPLKAYTSYDTMLADNPDLKRTLMMRLSQSKLFLDRNYSGIEYKDKEKYIPDRTMQNLDAEIFAFSVTSGWCGLAVSE